MSVLRPTLIPGLPRAWRGPTTLQLGYDPARAVLLDLPDPRAAAVLDLLDGTRSERVALAQASMAGIRLGDARELLDTLRAVGLLLPGAALVPTAWAEGTRRRLMSEAAALALRPTTDDLDPEGPTPAEILRGRAAARVVVAGRGRLGAGIAVALAEAGVGHVHPDLAGAVIASELAGGPLSAADVGRPRAEATAAAIEQAALGTRTSAVRRPGPDLTVQLDHDQPVALLAAAFARRRQPHLAVTVREGVVVVGPLVPASGAPCLNCAELYRRERDVGGPAQWAAGPEPCAVATVLAATAYVVAEVLAFLDARTTQPPPTGLSRSAQPSPREGAHPTMPGEGPQPRPPGDRELPDRGAWSTPPGPGAAAAPPGRLGRRRGARPTLHGLGAQMTLGASVEISGPGSMRRRTWPPHPGCRCVTK